MASDRPLSPGETATGHSQPREPTQPTGLSLAVLDRDPALGRPRGTGMMVAGLVILLLVAGVAFALGQGIQSSEQAIAEAAPPDPTVMTVPVEERQLIETLTFRADVNLAEVDPIVFVSTEDIPIITEVLVEEGETVEEGMALFSVNGARVFALQGTLPLYRDLAPYSEGPDVAQLQDALLRLGFDIGERGVFDAVTQQSVQRLFQAGGVATELSGDTERVQALREAEAAADAGAEATLAARENLQVARSERQASIAAAESGVEAAEAQAGLVAVQVGQSVDQAESVLAAADADVARLEQEVPVDDEALAEAHGTLVAAEDGLELAVAEAEVARQQAARAVEDAIQLLERARSTPLAPYKRAVSTAEAETARLEKAMDEAQQAAGLVVRRDWLYFTPELPARVTHSQIRPGLNLVDLTGPLVELSNGDLIAVGQVDDDINSQLVPGLLVEVNDGSTTVEARVVRANKADDPPNENPDGSVEGRVFLEFVTPPPADWRGLNVKVTASFNRTERPVMTAPVSAIFADASGGTYVRRVTSNGEVEKTTVRTGAVAAGYVEIKPIDSDIAVGDKLEIGMES